MSSELASDWNTPAFGARDTVQRRRVLASSRVASGGADNNSNSQQEQYSQSATRTAYRDAIDANSSLPRPQVEKRNRSEGQTWHSSPGLMAALHQSNTTMKDYEPMQRRIEKKVVVDKIQQPKKDTPSTLDHTGGAVETTVVRLTGTRVRKVGMTTR